MNSPYLFPGKLTSVVLFAGRFVVWVKVEVKELKQGTVTVLVPPTANTVALRAEPSPVGKAVAREDEVGDASTKNKGGMLTVLITELWWLSMPTPDPKTTEGPSETDSDENISTSSIIF
jgi:hypothetical protein